MNIAIIAPSSVPFVIGGAENLWWSLLDYFNRETSHQVELIKLPSPERNFWEILDSYCAFSQLNLDHFDAVIVTKYPAWMVQHRHKIVYLQHKLRGLYDTYPSHLTTVLPEDALLRPLIDHITKLSPTRADLVVFWQLIEDLKQNKTALSPDIFALPNPLIRSLVHYLDAIALAPNEVSKYAAISQTVADRENYFPAGSPVVIQPHPSGLMPISPLSNESIFTTSRHDSAKRLDLLIRAYRQTDVSLPLKIAGEGPETKRLIALADGDTRIIFMGRLSPEALQIAYSNALFVPFIPYQEDLGLITLEAFASQKAVLTTLDSGGVAEMVVHQKTGLVVEANEVALAQAITDMCQQHEQTKEMGKQGFLISQNITWKQVVDALIDPIQRPKLLLLNTYTIMPPMGGGQQRIYQLYRQLAQWCDITLLALVSSPVDGDRIEICPNFTEIRVPKSLYFQVQEMRLEKKLKASVGDLSAILYHESSPNIAEEIAMYAQQSDLVILSHPYLYPVMKTVYSGKFWYEAHNVEADLKQSIIHDSAYLACIVDAEQACVQKAQHILACSRQDAERLAHFYDRSIADISVIANGTETKLIQPPTPDKRMEARVRQEIKDDAIIALFMASYHGPNNQALEHIIEIAPHCPHITFIVLGSVLYHKKKESLTIPDNVLLKGVVSDADKQDFLYASDIALNPMTSGSGTNLKMLDYAAAGLLIVSTPFGGRGGLLRPQVDFMAVEVQDMAACMNALNHLMDDALIEMKKNARASVVSQADWSVIAYHYWLKLKMCVVSH